MGKRQKKQKKQKKKKNRRPTEAPESSSEPQEPQEEAQVPLEEEAPVYPIRDLPAAIFLNIVYRFPVNYLQQLRSFSKSWLSLINHPRLIRNHLEFNIEETREFICNGYHDRVRRKLVALLGAHGPPTRLLDIDLGFSERPNYPKRINFRDFSKNMVLAGSIHGIVCLTHRAEMKDRYVALWNPTIRYWKPIALPATRHSYPLNWKDVSVGLGYEKERSDYTITCIVPLLAVLPTMIGWCQIFIYSTNRESWDSYEFISFTPDRPCCEFIVEGVPYWVGNDVELKDTILAKVCRYGFCIRFSFPEHIKNEDTKVYAVNLRGSVSALIFSPGEVSNNSIDLYVLNDYTWTRTYTFGPIQVPLGGLLFQCFSTGDIVMMTGFLDNDSDEFHHFWNPTTNNVLRNNEVEELKAFWLESYSHVQSLLRIEGMLEIAKENICRRIGEETDTWSDWSAADKEYGPYL